jgi:lipopolysaccharide transport system permease protein
VTILLLPAVVAVQLVLVLGVGCALAAANVFARDVKQLAVVALRIGFYLTPVLYLAEQLPPQYRHLLALNPMTHIIDAYRAVAVEGRLPGPAFAVVALVSVVALVIGLRIYDRAASSFADEL